MKKYLLVYDQARILIAANNKIEAMQTINKKFDHLIDYQNFHRIFQVTEEIDQEGNHTQIKGVKGNEKKEE